MLSDKKSQNQKSKSINPIPYNCLKTINNQMENYICQILIDESNNTINIGTGFFCEIPFPDRNNMLKVLLTVNHLINEKFIKNNNFIKIKLISNKKILRINLKDKIKFTNKEYDITIIEINKKDKIKNFLKLDERIIDAIVENKNKNNDFIDETLYITHYPNSQLSISTGVLISKESPTEYGFYHSCITNKGSSGSPIFTLNNKVFGMHTSINLLNEGIGVFLNYQIKKFISEMKLKELKEKYNLNIKNTDIEKIDLFNQKDEEFSKICFNKLKKVKLINNNIKIVYSLIKCNLNILEDIELRNDEPFDIKISNNIAFEELTKLKLNLCFNDIIYILERVNLEKLEILDLSLNNISDINILTKVNYPELKELILKKNNISDIKSLENAKFEKLEILNIGYNQISDIDLLKKVNFKNLKTLNLEKNKISNIDVLKNDCFPNLEILDLSYNNISDINILKEVNFKNLKKLCLNDNKEISDLKVMKYVNFKHLEKIYLSNNKISDIDILGDVDFKELKELFLSVNEISDINVLAKVKFPKLKILSFGVNNITNIDVLEKVNFVDLEILGFSKNKITDINVMKKTNFKKLYKLTFDDNQVDKKKNARIIEILKKKVDKFFPFGNENWYYYFNDSLE